MHRDRLSFKEQQGFLTFAQNNSTTDYLRLAYCQAISIKCSQKKIKSCAVIVDKHTMAEVTDTHRAVFDHIIQLPEDNSERVEWKLQNEWQAWRLTPYKETLKVESDILFPTSIDHWWHGMQQTEVCLTTKVLNYTGEVSNCRAYRKLFDENNLPDVYNGIMYFRFSKTGAIFFNYAKEIFHNWPVFRDTLLVNCRDEMPTTDVVFSLAAMLTGIEDCTNPALTYPTFTHMKGAVIGGSINTDWTEKLYHQFDDIMRLTIGFTKQIAPCHYYQKKFITDEIIARYEELYAHRK